MARDLVGKTTLVKDAASASIPIASGTAISVSNGAYIPAEAENQMVVLINNTAATAKIATIKAGDFLANGQGDLEISLAQNEVKAVTLTSMRFKDNDGNINIDFESGMTGFVRAIVLP